MPRQSVCARSTRKLSARHSPPPAARYSARAAHDRIASFPLQLKYALDYVAPGAALIGDAAHAVHPLAGQGLNLGLLDCAALVDVLGDAGGAERFADTRVLRRYERWRKSENLVAATAMDGFDRLLLERQSGAGSPAPGGSSAPWSICPP